MPCRARAANGVWACERRPRSRHRHLRRSVLAGVGLRVGADGFSSRRLSVCGQPVRRRREFLWRLRPQPKRDVSDGPERQRLRLCGLAIGPDPQATFRAAS